MAIKFGDIADRLVRLFSSLKLAVVLLILLAVVSVFGTLIPQELDSAVYIDRYGESGFRYLKAMGLIDLYHSFGFRLLTTLLTLNITVCTYRRLKRVIRLTFGPPIGKGPDSIRSLRLNNTLPDPKGRPVLERVLGDKGYRLAEADGCLYASKGRIGLWGDMISHASIIIIITGALAGSLGHTSTVNVYENGFVDEVYNWSETRDVKFGYRLYVDKVSIQYYPTRMKVTVRDRNTGADLGTYNASEGREFSIRGTEFTATPEYVDTERGEAALRVFREGRLRGLYDTGFPDGGPLAPVAFDLVFFMTGYENPPMKSLAATVRFERSGELVRQGVIKVNDPMTVDGLKVFITAVSSDSAGRNYVGFQITRDPGVWLVWAGFGMLLVGLMLSFTVYFRQVWIFAGEDELVVGGRTNKDLQGFMREYGGMIKSYMQEAAE